nr:eukaryotic translation initiation factor 1A [Tanacetum cinerariifolium]
MPKNKGKGGKNRKRGKNEADDEKPRLLKAYGELPENIRLNEGIAGGLDEEDDNAVDDYIEFEDEDIDKI